jgi:hypothetical protein
VCFLEDPGRFDEILRFLQRAGRKNIPFLKNSVSQNPPVK